MAKIYLDPGHNHSGGDTGATGYGLREQNISVQIGQKLKGLLEANGQQVKMSRYAVEDNIGNGTLRSSLSSRTADANAWGADLFVSIHCNAANEKAYGTETYAYRVSSNGYRLAAGVQKHLVADTGRCNRGVKTANFAVLRNSNMPAILVETAFIDNPEDNAFLGSEIGKSHIAAAIAKGICEYLGLGYKGPDAVIPAEHWCQGYLDDLIAKKYIVSPEAWPFDGLTTKSGAVALVDKVSGGMWTSDEQDPSVHWVQPHVISLCGKGIITDKTEWLVNPDAPVSKALLLALIDQMTGGTLPAYRERQTDHWGRNKLDSLCDKAVIRNPGEWYPDFEGEVANANTIALVSKACKR